jgi:hypothetical protein
MPKAPNTDERDKTSLRSAAVKVAEALRKAKVDGEPLRLLSKFDLIATDTDGWLVRIGTMGPELPRLEIWLDRYNGGEQRNFWFGFSAAKMGIVGKASDVCKLPMAQREIEDNDLVKPKRGLSQLKVTLEDEVFRKPTAEIYLETNNPLHLFATQLRLASRNRFRLQRSPASATVHR